MRHLEGRESGGGVRGKEAGERRRWGREVLGAGGERGASVDVVIGERGGRIIDLPNYA